jgi:multisubunit Na+/H+ antiporter MnhG subunit
MNRPRVQWRFDLAQETRHIKLQRSACYTGQSAMLSVLRNDTYRKLFLAQVASLLGTGLATVALGLLAYDLAGAVLGTALAIK